MTLPLSGDSAFFLDLYARFVKDPASVPADWRVKLALMEAPAQASGDNGDRIAELFRTYGHRQARLDPLEMSTPRLIPELDSIQGGEESVDLTLAGEKVSLPKAQAITTLGSVYCGTATLEASHVIDAGERAWVYERFEREILTKPDQDVYARTLEAVMLADEFEHFIKTKWPTKKRFGMEGAESSAVISREIFRCAAEAGVQEVVIGGMHRGRLATLATVLGKSLPALIAEIKGRDITDGAAAFTGDVPYHNGLAAEVETGAGQVAVRLLPHPSHLIVVAPVAVGAARARQEQKARANAGTNGVSQVLPFLMHTDAAFAGQGLVWELLQLSALAGYSVGGTVHLIVNNQIGFTTLPSEGRSSPHPSDIGKAFGVPIFHVNGEDPIAAAAVTRVAFAWRNATGKDAIIDLVCYRRNGHNELDEPRFTQPLTWSKVDDRPTLKQLHSDRVKAASAAAFDMAEAKRKAFHVALDHAYATYDQVRNSTPERQTDIFAPPQPAGPLPFGIVTGVARDRLLDLARRMSAVGDGFEADPKVRNFLTTRLEAIEKNSGFNFATAEALAFASLLDEGTSVRLSGQDSVRGTFTQRHLALHDRRTGQTAMPLAGLVQAGARFDAVNSPLIEYGVLSFEYGMSLADPTRLVVWEAQFGDFLNGAQVVVDQFIVTAEAKWRMSSGLVIALPHGLEGQGPDHSSARIERILQSCAGGNLVVANPSTPANLFHLYRRQVRGSIRKPLFLIAPKSLLRLRDCVSILDEIAEGTSFQPVIVEPSSASTCSKVVLCSGKIAYALKAATAQERINDVALVRVEQLYPFPSQAIGAILERVQGLPIVWCQEEPSNQGAWSFMRDRLSEMAPDRPIAYVGRPAMAAAAGGSIDRHEVEQGDIIAAALSPAIRAQAAE
ncbi:2-oxoglutarate dehydrogenase E1 component [Mesorhizobium sp. M0482]|uniref:2-oxoglutarate dehydrogenase E1 component n=1 Tax=Mesorhizobium sp. M0482 TaxID=2956948 RepID=UPI003336B5FD